MAESLKARCDYGGSSFFPGRCDMGGSAICIIACQQVHETPLVERAASGDSTPGGNNSVVDHEGPLSFIVGGY